MAKSESYTRGAGPSEDTHIKITEDNFADLGFSEDHIGALVRKPEAKGQGGPMHDESAAGRGGKIGRTQGPSSIDLLEKQYAKATALLAMQKHGEEEGYEDKVRSSPDYKAWKQTVSEKPTTKIDPSANGEPPKMEKHGEEEGAKIDPSARTRSTNYGGAVEDTLARHWKGRGFKTHDEQDQEKKDKLSAQVQDPTAHYTAADPRQKMEKLLKQYTRAAEILKADLDVNHKNTSVAGKSSGKDALNTKESFTTIHNYEARKKEHDQLLREYGFPSEQDPEANRYGRFVEVETDEKGVVMHNKPPWIVAENSELVAEINDEDSPTYHKSPKAKNREGKDTISIKKEAYARAMEMLKVFHEPKKA